MKVGRGIAFWFILTAGFLERADGQITNFVVSSADAFVCTGSPNYNSGEDLRGLNFGGAGALIVAPSAGPKGEFQTLLEFDLAATTAAFNSSYGSNHWFISGLALELTGNYGGAGEQPRNSLFPTISTGKFVIEWLSTNGWPEGTGMPNSPTTDGVCFDSLPLMLVGPHEILSTNLYLPPGDNVASSYPLSLSTNVLAELYGGGQTTFRLFAADDQIGYLFNSASYGNGNEPKLQVIARPILTIVTIVPINGGFVVTGIGPTNAPCHLQAATNLGTANWLMVADATADSSGTMAFTDTLAGADSPRFYRLSQ
jgi:hypothetical protein